MSVRAAIANASRWLMEACSTLLGAVCSPDFVWCGGAAWMTLFSRFIEKSSIEISRAVNTWLILKVDASHA